MSLRSHFENAMRRQNEHSNAGGPLLRNLRQERGQGGSTAAVVAALAGEIDLHNSPELRMELLDRALAYLSALSGRIKGRKNP